MTDPLSDYTPITFVADANTPDDVMHYAGRVYYFAPDALIMIGSGPDNPGRIDGVRGYVLTALAADGSHQWLLTSPVTPAIADAFNTLPGNSGWTSQQARAVYRTVGLTLLEQYHIPAPDVLNALQQLYQAAVTNATTAPPGG